MSIKHLSYMSNSIDEWKLFILSCFNYQSNICWPHYTNGCLSKSNLIRDYSFFYILVSVRVIWATHSKGYNDETNISAYAFKIWAATWDFQQCGMCDQQSLRSACENAQSDQSLCLSLEYSLTVKLLTEDHLEFLRLKGVCTGLSESTLIKTPHCWKSHVTAQMSFSIAKVLLSAAWLCDNDQILMSWHIYWTCRQFSMHGLSLNIKTKRIHQNILAYWNVERNTEY